MPKFSAYMKGGEGSQGSPGASIIDGVIASIDQLPFPNINNKKAFLVGSKDPKELWVWNEESSKENKWEFQGYTASKLSNVTASITTIPWSINAVPTIKTQFSTNEQNDSINFDFTLVKAQPAGFGTVSASSDRLSYTSEPTVSVTSNGNDWEKNFDFNFGIPEGAPAGFSTSQSTNVTTLEWDVPAIVEVIPDENTPNDSKSFLFNFGIPQGRAAGFSTLSANIESIDWTEDPTISISESGPNWGKNIQFDFKVPKTRPAGFGTSTDASATTIEWDGNPVVSVTTDGPDYAKDFHFGFEIPAGRPAGFGNITVTTSTLPSGDDPWVEVTTDEESPEYSKDFNFKFGLPLGVSAGFSTGHNVSVSTLNSGESAVVEISTVTTSPETAKEFNFHFGLPKGDALAIYDGIPFTTEDGLDYYWEIKENDNVTTTTLIFNRGSAQKIPICIYNNNNETIFSTFKLSSTTIEYEADEKFNGTMYLMMPATLQSIEVGTVSSTTYGNNPVISKSTGSTSTNIILDFIIPEGYPGHDIIDSITTDIENIKDILNGTTTSINSLSTEVLSISTDLNSLSTEVLSISTDLNSLSTIVAKKAIHISVQSIPAGTTYTITNNQITSSMRVVNIVWGTPTNVTSDITWITDTGILTLNGTFSNATSAEIDLIDFG